MGYGSRDLVIGFLRCRVGFRGGRVFGSGRSIAALVGVGFSVFFFGVLGEVGLFFGSAAFLYIFIFAEVLDGFGTLGISALRLFFRFIFEKVLG